LTATGIKIYVYFPKSRMALYGAMKAEILGSSKDIAFAMPGMNNSTIMTSGAEKITLVTVSDDHYLIMLAALIKSIEANISNQTEIDLWVVDDGISPSNRAKLERSVNNNITDLHWKKLTDVIRVGPKLPLDYSTWPPNIYIRLFIPEFILPDSKKVIFMDVDIINCRDLNDLWQTELQDNIVGAVLDPRIKTFDNDWGGIFNYKELGLDGNAKYFNSGLLLIDTEKWRCNDVTQKTLTCIDKYRKYARYPDQYGLNIVLMNQWLELDCAWNQFAGQDDKMPYNIHFVERKPIYKTYNSSLAFRDKFYHYLNQTEWKYTKPIGETKRYIKKIKNVFEKIRMAIF
jgi:lipopolysaccharide biosynthesis glycosyltransferase